jgi:hypothetical protein
LNFNHQQEPLVVAAVAVAKNDAMAIASAPPQIDEEKKDDDDSSMIVLARSKRKHTTKQSSEEESNSDEKEERMQQQQQQQRPEDVHQQKVEESLPLGNQDVDMNENNDDDDDDDDNNQAAMEVMQQQQLQQRQQQVLFAMEVAQQQQQQQERNNSMPTMVSEYSSSARTGNGSSGASNINGMSTSGSGSGGNNTGSGSNSNQGGSSGSGNDQEGGTSSNGNGSSGSGNDNGKGGSGEELMDNNEERNRHHHNDENNREKNNSVENLGTSSSNKANVKKMGLSILSEHNNAAAPDIGNTFQVPSNLSDPLHHHQDMKTQRRLSNKSLSQEDNVDKHAVRERKIQDKKRKRMNMRREYEDKMEQEMESSESSNDGRGGETALLRPGKPTTLDKAVSFTKTAKLVIKASPPFTVIYTNAAYSRLSGIDSHNAVGNPITTLLSLPTQQLSQLNFQKDNQQSPENSTEKATTQNQNSNGMNNDQDHNNAATDSNNNHAAAEAAGRARAATSKNDDTEAGIEKLVAASGYNKLNKVNIRHQMLGRNVKVYKSKRNEEEGSNGSSISSSSDSPHNVVACTMSISPIVSIPETYNAAIVPDKGDHHKDNSHQHKSKRRKHHHHNQRQVVSHYVIQLEACDDDLIKHEAEKESQASLSTKGELRQQRVKETTMKTGNAHVLNADNEVESSEVSESCKHVSAVA